MSVHPEAGFLMALWTRKAVMALAILAVVATTLLVLATGGQPLLDRHAFRQTQTALTAYWFLQDGYRLAYETPVAGYPWVMPFEFPLYQAIAAAIAQFTGLSLSLVGRLLSYAFLLLCMPVVASITHRLKLPTVVFAIFVALTFTTPVYVYWGRAFLIETAALFFGLVAIKFAVEDLVEGHSIWRIAGFSAFITLCLLQKVTTGLPILTVFALLFAIGAARQSAPFRRTDIGRWTLLGLAIFLPLALGYAWTSFTDQVKLASPLGPALTSSALSAWNWGTPGQRFSADLWQDVILTRIMVFNFGGLMGVGLILLALVVKAARPLKAIIITALVLGLLPLFLFSNLHIVHDYYQSSNIMFLTYALAVALGGVITPRFGGRAGLAFLVALMVANVFALVQSGYLRAMRQSFSSADRDVAVSRVLARELSPDSQFVAFGNDYSATFAFLSGRKSFTVPAWFKDLDKVIAQPGDYVEKGHLGAVVACSDHPSRWQLVDWAAAEGGWKVGESPGCAIAVPSLPLPTVTQPGQCRGQIERAELVVQGERKVISLTGWSASTNDSPRAPEGVFAELRRGGGVPRVVDMLRVPRPDVNDALAASEDIDFGVSRLLPVDLPSGVYDVALIERVDGRDISCPTSATLNLP